MRSIGIKAGMAVFCLFVWTGLLGWHGVGSMLGQITSAESIVPAATENTPKLFTHSNVSGTPLSTATLHADPDTLKETWLAATVDRVIDATHVVLGIAMRYGNTSVNRTLTVRTDAELWLPNTSWDGIPDSMFSMVLNSSVAHQKNWQYKIELKKLTDVSLPIAATLISGDSLQRDSDTLEGLAVRADLGQMLWEITATAADADSNQLRLCYKLRLPNGNWTGPPGRRALRGSG